MPGLGPIRVAVLGWGLLVACSDPICGCSPLQPRVVVAGVVSDASARAVPGAEVSLVGVIGLECAMDGDTAFALPTWAEPSPAVSDETGQFSMVVWAAAYPGPHCINLEARVPTSGATDTIRALAATFRLNEPLDTATAQFVVPQ